MFNFHCFNFSIKKKVTNVKNLPVKYAKITNSANKEQDFFLSIQPSNVSYLTLFTYR